MSIENIKATPQVSFSSAKVVETKTEIKTQEQKGDKKKLMLALAGLATVGIAAVGITMAIKKGKVPTELAFDDFKKIGKFDKGQALVKGRPYTGTIEVVNKKGKYVLEYADGILKSSVGPNVKKTYTLTNGAKEITNYPINAGARAPWFIKTTKIEDDKITRSFPRQEGELLHRMETVLSKQKDGSWVKTERNLSEELFKI